ncbi:SoxR reducing system RseC family protein [Thermosipho atlanticus]|uniref:Positive regulator of sigma(E), RseC/MucC n=1 Tax=Thermosipho atlanticus DSM 15807 TaxID=1123380 RepID=A0A1M5RV68_9BACT|nr:SoxR reducing system RseC family protein [Thermosipho atlanticus]SHH30069.1 positive regulator of sigma(E), RseC/MucC [Thermosipho atlanticus DSM 15807]
MKEVFRVSRIDDKYIYVERDTTACGSCSLSGSCNVQNITEMKIEKKKNLEVFPGDFLILDMKLRPALIAFFLYGLPIVFLIVGVGLGGFFELSDFLSFAIGISFMSVAFVINYFIDKKYKPEIVDVKHNRGEI